MTSHQLRTEQLSRYYQRGEHTVKALDQVNLTISPGEFLALVGSSGSGKSTLLNLLAGLDRPTDGEIYLGSEQFSNLNRRQLSRYRAEKVGMIFQSFNLVPHLTAQENVELALYFNHTLPAERKTRAVDMLTRLGLEDRLDHRPADLSGGEQQRVATARALVKEPMILFADEPTGNLDKENSIDMMTLLKDLHDKGLTIVMVTHDLELASRVSGRIVKMDYGQIVASDISGNAT